jgi:hypothetical protein
MRTRRPPRARAFLFRAAAPATMRPCDRPCPPGPRVLPAPRRALGEHFRGHRRAGDARGHPPGGGRGGAGGISDRPPWAPQSPIIQEDGGLSAASLVGWEASSSGRVISTGVKVAAAFVVLADIGRARRAATSVARVLSALSGVSASAERPAQAPTPWHFLYFFPLPQGQGSFRPTFSSAVTGVCFCSISPRLVTVPARGLPTRAPAAA